MSRLGDSSEMRSPQSQPAGSKNNEKSIKSDEYVPISSTSEVDDWIQSVRALKAKRLAEDEARNNKLEEDILRERRARQERRATRTRSISPTKSLGSVDNTPVPLNKSLGEERITTPNSPNHGAATSPGIADRMSRLKVLDQKDELPDLKKDPIKSPLYGSPSPRSTPQAVRKQPAVLDEFLQRINKTNANNKEQLDVKHKDLQALSARSSPDLLGSDAKSEEQSRSKLASQQHMNKLASILAGRKVPAATYSNDSPKEETNAQPKADASTQDEQSQKKLTHMTKGRARKQKNKQSSTPASQNAPLDSVSDVKNVVEARELPEAKATKQIQSGLLGQQRKGPSIPAKLTNSVAKLEPVVIKRSSTAVQVPDQSHAIRSSQQAAKADLARAEAVTPKLSLQTANLTASMQSPSFVQPRSPINRAKVPFGAVTRSHRPTKSVVSMTSVTDMIRSRANSLDVKSPTSHSISDPQTALAVWSIRKNSSRLLQPEEATNELFHDEIRIVKQSGNQERCYAWRGRRVSAPYVDHLDKSIASASIEEVAMGQETAEFLSCFADNTIITKFATRTQSSLFIVRSYHSGFAIDELPLVTASLCSGFAYVVIGSQSFLWLGKGCHSIESRAAAKFLTQRNSISQYTTISEGHETNQFLTVLNGRSSYASSAFWRLKRDISSYKCAMYLVRGDQVQGQQHLSPEISVQGTVYIFDTFFEVYVYISREISKEQVTTAIRWVKDHCRELGASRPFVPMALVLCPDSKLPRDLRAVLRFPPEESNTELRILELSSLESLLSRSTYTIKEFQDGLAFDVDHGRLECFVDKHDFAALFGIDRQVFERSSAEEQKRARATAKTRLSQLIG